MSDLHSISSNLSIKSNDDDELNLEERIGFKPDGTNNFMGTIYNEDTGIRKIMFDGAMPLHEFAPLLYEYLYVYIHKCKENETYMLSVITYESDAINIAILEGDNHISVKKKRVNEILNKLLYTFDNVYGLFILPGKKNTYIPGRKYRLQITFSELENSYKIYKQLKNKIRSIVNISDMMIESDPDSEDSDSNVVNNSTD